MSSTTSTTATTATATTTKVTTNLNTSVDNYPNVTPIAPPEPVKVSPKISSSLRTGTRVEKPSHFVLSLIEKINKSKESIKVSKTQRYTNTMDALKEKYAERFLNHFIINFEKRIEEGRKKNQVYTDYYHNFRKEADFIKDCTTTPTKLDVRKVLHYIFRFLTSEGQGLHGLTYKVLNNENYTVTVEYNVEEQIQPELVVDTNEEVEEVDAEVDANDEEVDANDEETEEVEESEEVEDSPASDEDA